MWGKNLLETIAFGLLTPEHQSDVFLMFKLSAILWPSRRLARCCLELHHGTFVSLSPCFSVITRLRRTELGQNSFSHKVHSVISTPTQSHGRNLKFGAAVYVPSLFQRRRGLDKDLEPSGSLISKTTAATSSRTAKK